MLFPTSHGIGEELCALGFGGWRTILLQIKSLTVYRSRTQLLYQMSTSLYNYKLVFDYIMCTL